MFYSGPIHFYRSLANSSQAGVPLDRALSVLRPRHPQAAIADDLATGSTLHQAMQRRSNLFEAWQIEIAAVGESTGRLDTSFETIAQILEEKRAAWLAILPGIIYPVLLLHLMPVAFSASLFISAGPKAFFAAVARFLAPAYAVAAVTAFGFPKIWPLLAHRISFLSSFITAYFATYLGLLVKAGVHFPRALLLSARASHFDDDEPRLKLALDCAQRGLTIVESLRLLNLFNEQELQALEAGEISGQVDKELTRIADMAKQRNRAIMVTCSVLAYPITVIIVGVLVAYKLVGFYSNLFSTFSP